MQRLHGAAPVDNEVTRQRLIEYHRTGDTGLRDRVIADHEHFIDAMVRRFSRRGWSVEDLRQVAALALFRAVERYDPYRGARFTTYATPTVLGELRRYLRDRVNPVHIPRGLQEARPRVLRAEEEYWREHGRPPTAEQLAQRTGLCAEVVIEAREAMHAIYPLSLCQDRDNEESGDTSGLLDYLGVDDPGYGQVDDRVTMGQAFHALDHAEQAVAYLRFFRGLSQARVARILGGSQMKVSRLEQRALNKMRRFLLLDGPEGMSAVLAHT